MGCFGDRMSLSDFPLIIARRFSAGQASAKIAQPFRAGSAAAKISKSRQGRKRIFVAFVLPSLRDWRGFGRPVDPALKRWAIFKRTGRRIDPR
jgi:hypothetical protein